MDVGLLEKARGREREMQGISPTHSCQIISLLKEDEIKSGGSNGAVVLLIHKKHLSCFLKVLMQILIEHTSRAPGILHF